MRILFVISSLTIGGAQRQVVQLSKEMVRRGHAVGIYTLTREVPLANELAGSAVDLVVDAKRTKLDFGVLHRLRRHIRTWQPDIVHGFLFDGDIYSRLAAAGTEVPVLNSERNDDYVLPPLNRLAYRLTARLSDGLVANSYSGAAFAQRLHRLDAGRVHVVWNGIDLSEMDARLAKGETPAESIWPGADLKRICVVGAIKPQKDYPLALRVARRLVDRDPAWRLICVGDELALQPSGYKAQVLDRLRLLGLESYVKFVGNRRDVPELMASTAVVLVTSFHEGFPNVVLEAMACGTPVATTDYSDVRRILPNPWQVVATRDEEQLAAVVERCLAERASVGSAQRRWVEAHATVSTSASAMLDVYAAYCPAPNSPRIDAQIGP